MTEGEKTRIKIRKGEKTRMIQRIVGKESQVVSRGKMKKEN